MVIKELLGKRIRELRIKNRFTQAKLAELVNIAEKHQSCIETGKHYPSAELIEKYAKVFDIHPTEVWAIKVTEPKEVILERINKKLQKVSYEEVLNIYRMLGI